MKLFALVVICIVSSGLYEAVHAQVSCAGPRAVSESIRRTGGQLRVTLIYSVTTGVSPLAEARRLHGQLMSQVELVDAPLLSKSPRSRLSLSLTQHDDVKRFPNRTLEYLDLKGRGLSSTDKQTISNAHRVLAVVVDIPQKDFAKNFELANRYVADLARTTNAYLSDDSTREFFSPSSWTEARLGEPSDLLSVSRHVTIHAFQSGDYLRAVSVGMSKLGLPDITVAELSAAEAKPVGDLIDALSQRIFENPLEVRSGATSLQIAALKPTTARRNLNRSLQAGSSAAASLCLYHTEPQQGDDNNRQLEIGFDRAPGTDRHAKRHALLVDMFGAVPSAILGAPSGDKELAEASRRAKEKIPRLKQEFNAGLRAGDRLLVKAPFRADDGSKEFMWVEIVRWSASGELRGLLSSDPRSIRSLRAGQEVTVVELDVYDYLRTYADGRTEGNETGRILQQRSGAK